MKKLLLFTILSLITFQVFAQKNKSFKKPLTITNSKFYTKKWRFLKPVLENKRVVALGESLHGVKEYNESKLEIIKYLHEEMDFNVLAIESDWIMNYYGNLYRNQVEDTLLLKEMFTPVWHTETHLELVRYLQTHPKLKIIGFDVTRDITDIESLTESLKTLGIDDNPNIDVLKKQYSKIIELYKNEKHFSAIENTNRDSIMAMNLEWIIDELYPNEKVIISAANAHIQKVQDNPFLYMGKLLHQKYQNDYYSIGFFHALGNPVHIY
ncbi:MAG: erythromycin esterase family protein [Saprospiraceae bacterium]